MKPILCCVVNAGTPYDDVMAVRASRTCDGPSAIIDVHSDNLDIFYDDAQVISLSYCVCRISESVRYCCGAVEAIERTGGNDDGDV